MTYTYNDGIVKLLYRAHAAGVLHRLEVERDGLADELGVALTPGERAVLRAVRPEQLVSMLKVVQERGDLDRPPRAPQDYGRDYTTRGIRARD